MLIGEKEKITHHCYYIFSVKNTPVHISLIVIFNLFQIGICFE
jgi:hypothetical protein